MQIKLRLSRDFVEFLQVNFATSTHPFASVLRWLFSITHCLQMFAIFRTQRVCFFIHFSGQSLSLFVSPLVTSNLKNYAPHVAPTFFVIQIIFLLSGGRSFCRFRLLQSMTHRDLLHEFCSHFSFIQGTARCLICSFIVASQLCTHS